MKMFEKGLYFITDRKLSKKGIVADAKAAIKGGAAVIQYREKELPTKEMYKEAKEIAELCREVAVLFLINDRIDLALAVEADGVHLGLDDMPIAIARKLLGKEKIIGITVHNLEEALEAEKLGADYVSVSPIFHTDTKKDAGEPAGIGLIKEVKGAVKLPIVAIGGINEENLHQVIEAGADSIAMISAIVTSDDVKETVERVVGKINDAAAKR